MAEEWPGQPLGFTADATGYHPVEPDDPEYEREGGNLGAAEWQGQQIDQEPIYTLDQFRRGEAPYAAVAMDNTGNNPLPYGTMLRSPQMPDVRFRLMDTGGAFKGRGLNRIDIARDTKAGANADENNRQMQFVPEHQGLADMVTALARQRVKAGLRQAELEFGALSRLGPESEIRKAKPLDVWPGTPVRKAEAVWPGTKASDIPEFAPQVVEPPPEIPEYPAQVVTPQEAPTAAPAFQFRTPQQMQVEEARQFTQMVQPAVSAAGQAIGQELAPIGAAIASTGQALRIPELAPEQIARLPGIVQPSAQMANLPAQFWNFAVSPEGLATAATFEIGGPLWRALLAAGFSAQAAQGAIESAMRGDWSMVPAEIATAALTAAGARTEARAAYPLQRPEPQIIPGPPGVPVPEEVPPPPPTPAEVPPPAPAPEAPAPPPAPQPIEAEIPPAAPPEEVPPPAEPPEVAPPPPAPPPAAPPPMPAGIRLATGAGQARVEAAQQAMRDAINMDYAYLRERADAIDAAREAVHEAVAQAHVEAAKIARGPAAPPPVAPPPAPEVVEPPPEAKIQEAIAGIRKAPETAPQKMRVQKQYLLEALDQAHKSAPEEHPTSAEHDAELGLINASDPYRRLEYGASLEERAAAEQQQVAELEPLIQKYGLTDYKITEPPLPEVPGTRIAAAGGPEFALEREPVIRAPRPEELVKELRTRINEARQKALPKITIEVPGDGTFEIVNSREAISQFRDQVRKRFPTTLVRPKAVPVPRMEEAAIPKLTTPKTTEDYIKIAGRAASQVETRYILYQTAAATEGKVVSTDGRRLIVLDKAIGDPKKLKLFDIKTGKRATEKEKGNYPNWRQVIPDPKTQQKIASLDTGEMMKLMNQAGQVMSERSKAVSIWRDKKGRLGVSGGDPEIGTFAGGPADPNTSEFLVSVSPEFFADGLRIARQLGHDKVDFYLDKKDPSTSPMVMQAKGMKYVLMPMRSEGGVSYKIKGAAPKHPMAEEPTVAVPPPGIETPAPKQSGADALTDYHMRRGGPEPEARARAISEITEGHESDQAGLEYHNEFIRQGRGDEPFYTVTGQAVTHNEAARLFSEKIAANPPVQEARPGEHGATYASPAPPVLGMERAREAVAPDPADDPNFTALPVDLPEAVRFSNQLLNVAISVKKKLSALRGQAVGVFTYGRKLKPQIHLRADIADLLTETDKARLRAEAEDFAARMTTDPREAERVAQERYDYLLDQAYEEAKTRPPVLALKVIWHEIGHAVDYMPHAAEIEGVMPKGVRGRGNILGHIAALHKYLKGVISLDPNKPAGEPLTAADRAKLHKEAEKQIRDQIGPTGEIVETILVEEPILRITGITPADVKNLFGMQARETMPELYKWFAEQTAETKKEIVRKAMRGLLDERLKALGKAEQIGVQTVEKVVRKRMGREPTQAEIRERFQKLFRDELKRRNLAEADQVRDELRGAIAWWHGTARMPGYFSTPSEMYAEAFSIFMNNPSALAKRAPTYARLIWNYMDHRPEVAEIYDKLQNEIKSGQVRDRTEALMLDSWDAADKRSLEEAQKRQWNGKDILDNVIYHVDRRFGPIYRAAKGAPNEGAVRAAIGNYLYRQTEHEFILSRINREVGEPMVKAGLDWKDLGRYLFYQRIVNERFKIFNPYGIAPDRALERLENMRQTIGERNFAALEDAARAFRQIYQERVAAPMKAERMWNDELQQYIDHNVNYATFDVQQTDAGPEDGIARFLKARYGNEVSGHIYRQIGTVKEIKNPATATVLKALSLRSATDRNTLKREAIAALLENDRPNVMEAKKRWVTDHWEQIPVENRNVGTVVYMRDGKPQMYYVRRPVADALNKGGHVENRLIQGMVHLTGWLKGLYTQLNYGFWPFNFVRDTLGWIHQMPGATPLSWMRELPGAVRAARATVKGRPNPAADRALQMRVIISSGDPRGVWAAAENEYEARLAGYGLNPAQWEKEADRVHGIVKAWNSYRELGQVVERTNKIAAMNYLDRKFPNMPEWKKAEIVRERGGSPDFLQRGASNPYIDFFAMFFSPWREAIRSVSRSARENPWSFAAKTTAFVVSPTIMQAVAASGGFGRDLEEQYRSIPDYDLSNYLNIPLGWADKQQKKVAYLRLPLWEPARILHQMVWGLTTGRGEGLLSLYAGTLPSPNALINGAWMWGQYELMNKNPYDAFRGKMVLNDTTFAAGGWAARKELLKYSWNQLGGALAYRFQNEQLDNPSTTDMETFLKLPIVSNALGRWVKVSNKGLADLDRTVTAPMEQQRAQTRLAVQEISRKMLNHENLTPNERTLMRDPYAMRYLSETLKGHYIQRLSPEMRRLKGKPREEQLLILQQR